MLVTAVASVALSKFLLLQLPSATCWNMIINCFKKIILKSHILKLSCHCLLQFKASQAGGHISLPRVAKRIQTFQEVPQHAQ